MASRTFRLGRARPAEVCSFLLSVDFWLHLTSLTCRTQ